MATTERATGDPLPLIAPIVAPPDPPQPPAPPPEPPAEAPPIDEEDRTAGATSTDKHVQVPHDAFRKIKDAARSRGKREAENDLAKRAAALGFPTVEAMFESLEKRETTVTTPNQNPPAPATTTATPAPPPAPAPGGQPQPPPAAAAPPPPEAPPKREDEPENDRRVPDNVRKKLRQAREEMRGKVSAAEAQAAAAKVEVENYKAQMAAMETEREMREDLIRAGAKELDFVYFEVKKHLAKLAEDKTPEGAKKLAEFDIKAWADEQKKTRPFLFGENPVPANTGAQTTPPPAAPNPADVTRTNGDGSKVDARALSTADFNKRMADQGINVRTTAPPLRPLR